MSAPERRLRTRIARTTAERIEVRGHDLADLIGEVSFGDMAFLELTGRRPTAAESAVFNALLVALVEHGLTPSALASRLTLLGAPESLQGAVAAGLLGLGDRYGGPVENAARMLQDALALSPDGDPALLAERTVTAFRRDRLPVPGLGHPQHTESDPRVARLFGVAAEQGLAGRQVALMEAIGAEASRQAGRHLPVNATGAIGALAGELGLSWRVCRGLALMARAVGLVAHLQEEMADPLAGEVWRRVDEEASAAQGED